MMITYTYIHKHIYVDMSTYKCIYVHICAYMRIHAHMHSRMFVGTQLGMEAGQLCITVVEVRVHAEQNGPVAIQKPLSQIESGAQFGVKWPSQSPRSCLTPGLHE